MTVDLVELNLVKGVVIDVKQLEAVQTKKVHGNKSLDAGNHDLQSEERTAVQVRFTGPRRCYDKTSAEGARSE